MNAPIMGTRQNIRFTDIPAGSRIRVSPSNSKVHFPPYEADVLETRAEYGRNGVPAIFARVETTTDPQIITETGDVHIDIIRAANAIDPAAIVGAMRLRTKPTEVNAIRFEGGQESALHCIQFVAGKARPVYHDGSDGLGERLEWDTLESTHRVRVSDWIIAWPDGTGLSSVPQEVVYERYEAAGA